MIIGAHYYAWYKKPDWALKTLRYYLGQVPVLGENYNNVADFNVVRKQFEQCRQYGIDFLLISYKDENILPYLEIAEQVGIKITLHCETLEKADSQKITKKEIGKVTFDAPRIRDWMHHPAWLKIKNKPAIAYYVTRQVEKACLPEFVSRLREAYKDCYLIGDEVWWNEPDLERLKQFDAVYAYNMYINKGDKMDKGRVISQGPIGQAYLDMIRPYEQKFFDASRAGRFDFIPTVLPGYNDRAVRLDVNHYAIPREEGSFFQSYLQHASSFLDDGILFVTSFNEWYEDSQIEAVKQERAKDEKHLTYTENLAFEEYGTKYLEQLQQFKASSGITPREKPSSVIENAKENVPVEGGIPLSRASLLDECAMLYYQTTLLPTISLNELAVSEIRKTFYIKTEEAHKQGITVKEIRQRAKQLTHYFSVHRDTLLKEHKNA